MTTFSFSTDAPAEVKAGVLILPVFQGPEFGPGVKETAPPAGVQGREAHREEGRIAPRHEAQRRPVRGRRRPARWAWGSVGISTWRRCGRRSAGVAASVGSLRARGDDVPAGGEGRDRRCGPGRRGRARSRRLSVRPLQVEERAHAAQEGHARRERQGRHEGGPRGRPSRGGARGRGVRGRATSSTRPPATSPRRSSRARRRRWRKPRGSRARSGRRPS